MIIFDVETSGLDENVNGVVGLGAIIVPGKDDFYAEPRLDDGLVAHPEALRINGFEEDEIRSKDRPDMKDVLKDFGAWARKADDMLLCGWNGNFDFKFVKAEFERCGLDWPFGYRSFDLHTLAYYFFRLRDQWTPMHHGYSTVGLNYTLKKLGLPAEPDPHNALTGAQCNLQVLTTITKMLKYSPMVKAEEPGGIEIGAEREEALIQQGLFDGDYQSWLDQQIES